MPLPTTASRRSFGTTTMVSTCLRISAIPISACRMRLRPSNRNGLVTIAIVRAPKSRAICEMIGAAPVPVPPPMPQVTNTKSAPWSPCSTSSRFSSIAWRPISGRAPAPSPRVSFLPICTFTSALLLSRAWASVFTEMNSTPWSPSSTMRFRALPPPPPTPTTFIRAFWDTVSSSSKIMAPSGDRSEEILQPPLQGSEQLLDPGALHERAAGRPALRELARGVQHQPHRHRVARRLHAVDEPGDPLLGAPGPHGQRERLARELHHARQMRRPAREHDPRGQPPAAIPRALEFALHQLEDLVDALVDDVRQQFARRLPRPLARRGRQRDHLRRVHEGLVGDAVPLLQPLRVGLRHAESLHQIARDVGAGEFERREVADLPFVKDGDAGRGPAHFDQRDAQLPFVVPQHRIRGGERLEHQVGRPVARALDAPAQVLRGRGLHRHEVHLHLEPRARHAHRVGDAVLLVDHILLRDVVQQLVVAAERHGAGHLVHPRDVLRGHFVRRHRHDASRGAGRHVLAGDPQVSAVTFTPAIRSASRIAATIDWVVSSMSRTIPRRTPAFLARPTPSTFASGSRGRSPTTSAITAHVLVLPRSSPATSWRSRLTRHRPRLRSRAGAPPLGPRSARRAPGRDALSLRDPARPVSPLE